MREVAIVPTFEAWQSTARVLLAEGLAPGDVSWREIDAAPGPELAPTAASSASSAVRVPSRFLDLARRVARHRDSNRWRLLYSVLWRLAREDRNLLRNEGDAEIARLLRLEREMLRDTDELATSRTSPATAVIAPLLAETAAGEQSTARAQKEAPSARPFIPAVADLPRLREAVRACTGCDLYRCATQAVFGDGPASARIALVGEQPGDQEDLRGAPFVGPAGEVLDRALAAAGLERGQLYVTNAVKHFKFIERGRRRIHQTPRPVEIVACRPWLEAELEIVRPSTLVCLGATAARALLGPEFRLTRQRGEVFETRWARRTLATYHPSAVLRADEPSAQEQVYAALVADLRTASAAA